jgi:hypothetical protein
MSKNRKKVFPKKPERLTTTSAKLLGKNSNKACYEASVKAIYKSEPKIADSLTLEQRRYLVTMRRTLAKG